MLKSVIILAGAIDSGKSTTLREIITRLQKVEGERFIYSISKKKLCVYLSSPQESIKPRYFCHFEKVEINLERKIVICNSFDCALLIVPFTMKRQRGGSDLNSLCITQPVEYLRKKELKIYVVYLRKERLTHLNQMDEVMSSVNAHIITSSKDGQKNQADELWKIIEDADP